MPQSRVSKPPSSSLRRKRLSAKIDFLGLLVMARCPQCEQSDSMCVVLKGYARCSSCTRKNIQCGGTFSDAEFEELDRQRRELRRQAAAARERLAHLAQELLSAQAHHAHLEQQLESVTAQQSQMVLREAHLLDELEGLPSSVAVFPSDLFPLDPGFVGDSPSSFSG